MAQRIIYENQSKSLKKKEKKRKRKMGNLPGNVFILDL